jgi:hypothetical protein
MMVKSYLCPILFGDWKKISSSKFLKRNLRIARNFITLSASADFNQDLFVTSNKRLETIFAKSFEM